MKTTLVTGGSGSIGAGICKHLVEHGHRVINVSVDKVDLGKQVETVVQDLADEGSLEVLKDLAARHEISGLVNAAGIIHVAPVEALTVADIDRVFAINTRAAIMSIAALAPNMKARGFGRIVTISSRAELGKANRTLYAMSKSALKGMTRSVALELAEFGVMLNNISPGPIETPLFRANNPLGSPQAEAFLSQVPVKRVGQPKDIAHAVEFFLSDHASFITGQNLYVCGGLSIMSNWS